MTTVRLDIEYDGAGFRGWARQPGLRTVQGVLEAALAQVLREEIQLTVAGRTDTGVHALGQVASFATEAALPADLARNLNGVTPHDVAVRRAATVADGFDARRDARSRSYLYRVATRPAAEPVRAGPGALAGPTGSTARPSTPAPRALVGTHDFTAFTPTQTDHVRFERDVLAASWREDEPATTILTFRITADAFMRNMVRALVGTMLRGRLQTAARVENFSALLEGATAYRGRRHRPTPRACTWSPSATTERAVPELARRARGRPSRSSRCAADRA